MNNSPAKRRLQMADIARMAGVSASTVSRALNGSPLINKATRERIVALAHAHNYTINVGAKNLRIRRNQTIAVVIPYEPSSRRDISDPFYLSMVGSLADAVTDRGYDLLVSRVRADDIESVSRPYDSGQALGVVLVGQRRHDEWLNEMAARRVPFVVWGPPVPHQHCCSVGGDNVAGGRLATEHLLWQGRRRLLFVGDTQLPQVELRYRGHLQALAAARIEPRSDALLSVPFDVEIARPALQRLLASNMDFDGVVACSDLLGITAIRVLRELGHAVPRDVAVVGYDDMPVANFCDPPLSAVHQPVTEAGVAMVEALLAISEGERIGPRVLPVSLVTRASSLAAQTI